MNRPLSFKLNMAAGAFFFAGGALAWCGGGLWALLVEVPGVLLMVAYHIQQRRERR